MPVTQLKKLSVATVYGKIKLSELIKAADQRLPVMTVMGIAVSIKTGPSAYGDGHWRAFMGTFRAINPETGEVFEGSQLFLPDIAFTPIEVALANSRGVEFAIKVSVMYVGDRPGRKAGGAAYEYTFEPLVANAEENPLDRIMSKISNVTALPAPERAAEPPAKQRRR